LKKACYFILALVSIAALIGVVSFGFMRVTSAKASAGTCQPTGFIRDNTNLTAAVIATANTTISGPISPIGCNIGIYYGPGITGTVSNATVADYNYFGIVNNGGTVTITNSRIYQIGETPFNGSQHGVGIYFAYGSMAKGTISNNIVWDYQKGGIVVNGVGSSASVNRNTVIGQGPINYIAQNGIQIGYGAKATVNNNLVSGNSYTGSGLTASGGIIVVGGSCYHDSLTLNTKITNNTVMDNDIGIWLTNIDIDPTNPSNCVPTLTPTKVQANKNISTNNYVNNTTGAGASAGYQAGIADQGRNDTITNNAICGYGYTYNPNPPPYLFAIDATATNAPIITGNVSCSGNSVPPAVPSAKIHFKTAVHANTVR
jgi:hypothetical protein